MGGGGGGPQEVTDQAQRGGGVPEIRLSEVCSKKTQTGEKLDYAPPPKGPVGVPENLLGLLFPLFCDYKLPVRFHYSS